MEAVVASLAAEPIVHSTFRAPDNKIPFSMLPQRPTPWKHFGLSAVTHVIALLALIAFGSFAPRAVRPDTRTYRFTSIVEAPPVVSHEEKPAPPVHRPEVVKAETPQQLPVIHLAPEKRVVMHQQETPVTPQIEIASRQLPVQQVTPVIPKQLIKTNVFSTGSSAPPTIVRPPENVQTEGFGDPNGVPAHDSSGKGLKIAQLGAYDLPQGPGNGNGSGGQHGAVGTVASAGFGNGVATVDRNGGATASRGAVRQAGFGDAATAVASETKPKTASVSPISPAEILSKPTPVYTAEARKLKIEGEVLLEVVFEGSGKLRVVRLVKGLGHGLDEAAEQAAKEIRFKPALRDGQPADSSGVLHIIFQLS